MLDQNAPHQLCSDREKMRAILPATLPRAKKTEERFVCEGGGLEGVSWFLAAKLVARQTTKLGINDGNQLVERLVIALFPSYE